MLNHQDAFVILSYVNSMLVTDPKNHGCWMMRGNTLAFLGELALAENAYENATETNDKNGLAWHRLGMVKQSMGKHPDEVLTCLRRAVSLSPNESSFIFALSDPIILQGDIQGALKVLRVACALSPGNEGYSIKLAELLEASETTADKIDFDTIKLCANLDV
jgi:cytochrome c-type biogenesis protein CcmH/NrfG